MDLQPLTQDKFELNVKRNSKQFIDFVAYFQPTIERMKDFAIGPYFWLIPDQVDMTIFDTSDNIGSFTPKSRNEWKGNPAQNWIDCIHPDDRVFFFSATHLSIQLNTSQENININMYLRMANADQIQRWVLIQYPEICLNENKEVISGIVFITDISHLQAQAKCMMTVTDKSNNTDKIYVLKENLKELDSIQLPSISKREREILTMMASGLNTPQIAEKLFISYHTVENHKRNLRTKTKAKTSAELMSYALKYHII
jgi:DNA-binding CsgD family transcriptional regulator